MQSMATSWSLRSSACCNSGVPWGTLGLGWRARPVTKPWVCSSVKGLPPMRAVRMRSLKLPMPGG